MASGFNHENGQAVLSGEGREVMLWVAFLTLLSGGSQLAVHGCCLSLCAVLRAQAGCINIQ